MPYLAKYLGPELLHEEDSPVSGDPDHDHHVLLGHQAEDPPGQVPGVCPPLQPGEDVHLLVPLAVITQPLNPVLTLKPTN